MEEEIIKVEENKAVYMLRDTFDGVEILGCDVVLRCYMRSPY